MGEGDNVNKFAPFPSELDWRVACWAVQEGIGHKLFDRLLAIPGVINQLGLSYHNICGLHQILWFKCDPDDKHFLHHCSPLEAIETLLGNPTYSKDVVYRPKCIFTDATKKTRIYHEMWTRNWWYGIQKCLPKGAALAPFSGGKVAYPVYLTLGNIPRAIHHRPSQHACMLITFLSVGKEIGCNLTKKTKILLLVLEPLIQAGKEGMEVVGGDGKCLVTCAKYGTCPKCQATKQQLGDQQMVERHTQRSMTATISNACQQATSASQFQQLCKEDLVSGGVHPPFWEGFPFCNIHMAVTSDVLHQLYQGVVKHLVSCVCHFTKGWSKLSQISGKERKDMARILLGCLVGKVPTQVITAFRALLDFVYIAQCLTQKDTSLQYMEDALDLFHQHKAILTGPDLDIHKHLNIPKFHLMLHYMEDEVPQMTQWLSRQEKPSLIITSQTITSIQNNHACPFLSYHLKLYLNSLMPPGETIPRAQIAHATLPFDRLDVWHSCKFALDILGNDVDGWEGADAVKES
ncbi:hypothetical protein BS17DRAFT_794275 [Gyrodon lividus]|nr:hypothetical protein BS17DRAFT_794275 [Gyrodon lividus]